MLGHASGMTSLVYQRWPLVAICSVSGLIPEYHPPNLSNPAVKEVTKVSLHSKIGEKTINLSMGDSIHLQGRR